MSDATHQAETTLAAAGLATFDTVTEISVEEQERKISSTIEGLPDAAAILTYED